MQEVTVRAQFNGPDGSANGGYISGVVAGLVGAPAARVRLRMPPPLDTPLRWDGRQLFAGDVAVADGEPVDEDPFVDPARIPSLDEAIEASRKFRGHTDHMWPGCFACGTARAEHDGLRVFAGPTDVDGVHAAPWTPSEAFAEDGRIPDPITWAALDCPGGWAALAVVDGDYLLGTMSGSVLCAPEVGVAHVALGWFLEQNGRKVEAATAIYTADGERIAHSRQTWVRLS